MILALLMPTLLAVALCGLNAAVKAGIAVVACGYGTLNAVLLWRRPAVAVIRDACGAYWLERKDGRERLERVCWRDFGHLVRLQASFSDSGRRVNLIWWTAAMPPGQRRALRQAMNAGRTPQAGALPATVANPLL